MLQTFIDQLSREVNVHWATRLRAELTNRGVSDPIAWDAMCRYVQELAIQRFTAHAAEQTRRALHEG